MTRFYKENMGKYTAPLLRALSFRDLCERQPIHIGEDELIVGERGGEPKAVPTYPELTCHSLEDLEVLNTREKNPYLVSDDVFDLYREEIVPFWRGRSLRDRAFSELPQDWVDAYQAGMFTEFMEQRAPGHTAGDGKLFRRGLLSARTRISDRLASLDFTADPLARAAWAELSAMNIAVDALIAFARRHAKLARALAARAPRPERRRELLMIAEVCDWVPAHPPRNFWEAVQAYWFYHLGVITELNGWDAFNPGHLDQHLYPFYQQDLESGTLTRDDAAELLSCLWIKFNNQPAPPKVGVTAAESGTYNDFVNINLGGLRADGGDGANELSYLILEVADELQLLQPQCNVQLCRVTPDQLLEAACRVIRHGHGYPALFNADMVVEELLRQGKSIEDAREGGISGCVESGAFGKEAYVLSGYFNLPKVLEIALHDGLDPRTGKQIGPSTGDPSGFSSFDMLLAAWERQLRHFIDVKIRGNAVIQSLYASEMPAPLLSTLIDDCIATGMDYNAGGARYNTTYIQGVGIGTLADSLSAILHHIYERKTIGMKEFLTSLREDFAGEEILRQELLNKTPRYGNDDERVDVLMQRAFQAFFRAVDGRPAPRGGRYHINMLPTTCHIYFGSLTGATPDGRRAGQPLSEGISPVQGRDTQGPTAVIRSAAKMDHAKTGGTLLNMKVSPQVVSRDADLKKFSHLIRSYFALGGHHIQFNVVSAQVLKEAQARPEEYRGMLVRVAGYSDYFCDLSRTLQDEIIARTEHDAP